MHQLCILFLFMLYAIRQWLPVPVLIPYGWFFLAFGIAGGSGEGDLEGECIALLDDVRQDYCSISSEVFVEVSKESVSGGTVVVGHAYELYSMITKIVACLRQMPRENEGIMYNLDVVIYLDECQIKPIFVKYL